MERPCSGSGTGVWWLSRVQQALIRFPFRGVLRRHGHLICPRSESVCQGIMNKYGTPFLVHVVIVVDDAQLINLRRRFLHLFSHRILTFSSPLGAIFLIIVGGRARTIEVIAGSVINASSSGRAEAFFHRIASHVTLVRRRAIIERRVNVQQRRPRVQVTRHGDVHRAAKDLLIHFLRGLLTRSTFLHNGHRRFLIVVTSTRLFYRLLSCLTAATTGLPTSNRCSFVVRICLYF